ncbi:MAG: VCBS repeat-containing protein [Caldilineaceae bacterium]
MQGVTLLSAEADQPTTIALSWHATNRPLQLLTVPTDPTVQEWSIQQLSLTTQSEALSATDIDRDGDTDLMLGTQWLRHESTSEHTATWRAFTLAADTNPDRHRLADLNGDGRLDVVVGFEGIGVASKLAWYAQPMDPTTLWPEQIIDHPLGPMSLDLRATWMATVTSMPSLGNMCPMTLYAPAFGSMKTWTAKVVRGHHIWCIGVMSTTMAPKRSTLMVTVTLTLFLSAGIRIWCYSMKIWRIVVCRPHQHPLPPM